MSKVLADSDFLIGLFRKNQSAIKFLEKLVKKKSFLYTTSLNVAELSRGAYKSKNVSSQLSDLENLFNIFEIIDFNYAHALKFGEVMARTDSSQIFDLLIAAVALEEGTVVLTRNKSHFEPSGVKIISW